jgi:hypothetical protein
MTVEINGQKVEYMVPAAQHPSILTLPFVCAPGILRGDAPSAQWPEATLDRWIFKRHIAGATELVRAMGGTSFTIRKDFGGRDLSAVTQTQRRRRLKLKSKPEAASSAFMASARCFLACSEVGLPEGVGELLLPRKTPSLPFLPN